MSNDNQKKPEFTKDQQKPAEDVSTNELTVQELEERIAPVSLGFSELEDRIAPVRIV